MPVIRRSAARKQAARKVKGTSDRVQIKPREQAPVIGTATVVKIDLAQNNCDIQLAEGVIVPKVRLLHNYKPTVEETCKTILIHPAIYVTSPLTVVDPYLSVS